MSSRTLKKLRNVKERLGTLFTRKSRKGNYNLTIYNNELATGLTKRDELLHKKLSKSDIERIEEKDYFTYLNPNLLVEKMIDKKKKRIESILIPSDFAQVNKTDFNELRDDDLVKKMIDKKKERLQSRLIPSEFERISETDLKQLNDDDIIKKMMIEQKKEEIYPKLRPSEFALISEYDFERLSANEIITHAKKLSTITQKFARRTISNFLTNKTTRRKLNYIKMRCNTPNVCMALGIYTDYIKKHFNFTNFNFVTNIASIGKPSGNGFVNIITYTNGKTSSIHQSKSSATALASIMSHTKTQKTPARARATVLASNREMSLSSAEKRALENPVSIQDFTAYAILKSNLKRTADNLLYEYMVGLYINTLNKRFPCFLETYGYYTYNNVNVDVKVGKRKWKLWDQLQHPDGIEFLNSKKELRQTVLKNNMTLHPLEYTDVSNGEKMEDIYINACTEEDSDQKRQSILIQYFDNVITFYSFLKKTRTDTGSSVLFTTPSSTYLDEISEIVITIITILFQVYFPLAQLKDNFTHYDLHTENVLLYIPNDKKYIEYHYYDISGGDITTFKSKYMVKIIDYGRCFFKYDVNKFGTEDIDFAINKEYSYCHNAGFWPVLYNNDAEVKNDDRITPISISRSVINSSTDLRLLHQLSKFHQLKYDKEFKYLLYDVEFGGYGDYYTVVPDPTTVARNPNKIYTVNDAYNRIKQQVNRTSKNNMDHKGHPSLFSSHYENMIKLGDLHIYADGRDMEYIEFNESMV